MFPPTTKILILDDTGLMRTMMRNFLSELGYRNVIDAVDGVKGWIEVEKAARDKAPFNLIISDWNMPNMSGLELLTKVRHTDYCKTTPFIMLTAETEKDKVMQALEAGVTNYITKPFTKQIIKDKLKAVWDKVSSPTAKAS